MVTTPVVDTGVTIGKLVLFSCSKQNVINGRTVGDSVIKRPNPGIEVIWVSDEWLYHKKYS